MNREEQDRVERDGSAISRDFERSNLKLSGRLSCEINVSKMGKKYEDGLRFEFYEMSNPTAPKYVCTFYTPGILLVEGPQEEMFPRVYEALCSIWPYLKKAIPLVHYGTSSVDKDDLGSVLLACCDSFMSTVANSYREPGVKERISDPRNPRSLIWPRSRDTRLSKSLKAEVEKKLLFAFDAEKYLEMIDDCLDYYSEYIGDFDADRRKTVKENLEYMKKWTAMRREDAHAVSEMDRHSSQVAVQKLIGFLSYEIIILTFVQVYRTIYTTPVHDPFWLLLVPVIIAVFAPVAWVAIEHFRMPRNVG
ncbi:MAG TPA: hypothetical protein VEJ36_03285 [Nitrososphaerales archaeon]|nr:hypothetical protein [Nitrososphaerales archaeon]